MNKLTKRQHLGGAIAIMGAIALTLYIKLDTASNLLGIVGGVFILLTGLSLLLKKEEKNSKK